MKKILFLVFTVLFGFSVASAKKVEISVDFDYTDADTFNFFYELRHETSFSKFLVANYDMLNVFYNRFNDLLSSDYADLNANKLDYSIYFSKSNNHYFITLIYTSLYTTSIVIEYDENMNYVNYTYTSNASFNSISFNPIKRDGRLECYEFFSFWQGSHNYFISGDNSYTLNRYYLDGKSYINFTDDDSFWRVLLKGLASQFEGYHFTSNMPSVGLNLDYYTQHQIASKYTSLAYVRNIFFDFPNYDLKDYEYFYLNEVEQGAFLVPQFDADAIPDVDFKLYFASPESGGNFLSTVVSVKKQDEECVSQCVYEPDDNYDYLNKDYAFFNTIIQLDLRNFYSKVDSNAYSNYVYHFFSTTYNTDVIFYYNPKYWKLLVPKSEESTTTYRREDFFEATKDEAVKSWDNVNESVGGILGSFGKINPTYGGSSSNNGSSGSGNGSSNSGGNGTVSGGDSVNGIFSGLNPKDIISNLNGIFSTMVTFINDFLGTFPDGIRMSINFFFIMALAAAVVKLLV